MKTSLTLLMLLATTLLTHRLEARTFSIGELKAKGWRVDNAKNGTLNVHRSRTVRGERQRSLHVELQLTPQGELLRRTIRLNEKAGPGPDKNETKYTREYVPGRGTTISESVPGGPESGLARIDRTTLYDAHGQRIAHTEKKLDTRGNFTVSSQGPAGNASSIGHETWGTKWTATTRQRPAGQPSYELHVANALEGQFTLTAKPTVAGLALELFANGLSDATIAGQPFSTPLKHFIPGKLLEILPPQIDGLPATMLQSLHDAF